MGLPLGTNFELNAEKFNFERDSFATLAEMKAFPLSSVPDGFTAFCEQDFNHYIMCKGCNPSEETGHWRNISTVTDFFDNPVDEFNYNRPVAYGPWREDRMTIVAALGDKVDKVDGKGLSTNDYTTAEKQKLAGLSNYDDNSVVKSIKINGETKTPTAGLVDLGNIDSVEISQTTGQSTTAVMSQKAVTDEVSSVSRLEFDYILGSSISNNDVKATWVIDDSIFFKDGNRYKEFNILNKSVRDIVAYTLDVNMCGQKIVKCLNRLYYRHGNNTIKILDNDSLALINTVNVSVGGETVFSLFSVLDYLFVFTNSGNLYRTNSELSDFIFIEKFVNPLSFGQRSEVVKLSATKYLYASLIIDVSTTEPSVFNHNCDKFIAFDYKPVAGRIGLCIYGGKIKDVVSYDGVNTFVVRDVDFFNPSAHGAFFYFQISGLINSSLIVCDGRCVTVSKKSAFNGLVSSSSDAFHPAALGNGQMCGGYLFWQAGEMLYVKKLNV